MRHSVDSVMHRAVACFGEGASLSCLAVHVVLRDR